MGNVGRNTPCPCGSGKKYKRCCLNSGRNNPLRFEKISDIGTSYPPMARLGLGLFEIADLSNLNEKSRNVLTSKGIEIARLLHQAEEIAAPIVKEIQNIYDKIFAVEFKVDKSTPSIPWKCENLSQAKVYIQICEQIFDLFFAIFNEIWNTGFDREAVENFELFLSQVLPTNHPLQHLIKEDKAWILDLNNLIRLAKTADKFVVSDFKIEISADDQFIITMPSFPNGLHISDYLKVLTHNLFTFIEEFTVLSLGEFLDERLKIYEFEENNRNEEAPIRYRIGLKSGVEINTFKDHPKFDKIFKSGQPLFHLRDQLREHKYGKVQPIVHAHYNGRKIVKVGSEIFFGNWITFVDFLFDYIKFVFGKEWWLAEAQKSNELQSPVLRLAIKTSEYQKMARRVDGDLFSIKPNGPMHAYMSIAYDLYILADNLKLQKSLIRRMKQQDKTNFWGARYEAMVAATFIKAGFDIEYEDESNGLSKHPEFIAIHKITGEKIAVEAKKKNRKNPPASVAETKLNIDFRIKQAVEKYMGLPYVLFLELDLPPIEGDPMGQPWIQELLESSNKAGVRDFSDGKDFINLIVFTNYPTEHLEDQSKYPKRNYYISLTTVPKTELNQPMHWGEIIQTVEKNSQIPSWFEE